MGLNLIRVHAEHETVRGKVDPASKNQHASLKNKYLDAIWILSPLEIDKGRERKEQAKIQPRLRPVLAT